MISMSFQSKIYDIDNLSIKTYDIEKFSLKNEKLWYRLLFMNMIPRNFLQKNV